jgi:hypothetical protein
MNATGGDKEGTIIFSRKQRGREDIEKNAFACRWAFFECPTIAPEESSRGVLKELNFPIESRKEQNASGNERSTSYCPTL